MNKPSILPQFAVTTIDNAYIAGTDVDIAHMILQGLVDHIEVSALEKFKDGDL